MAESPEGAVLLFGGYNSDPPGEDRILELCAGANSWNILDTTLKIRHYGHVVIPLQ